MSPGSERPTARRTLWTTALVALAWGCRSDSRLSTEPRSDCIDLRGPARRGDVGFGERFTVEATRRCPAEAGTMSWKQISGPAVSEITVTPDGLRFEARLPSMRDTGVDPPSWGIVPISPRTMGEVVLEAEWRSKRGPEALASRARLRLAAASRSRGIPNVAVDQGILLAGDGWSIARAPDGAQATLEPGEMARLVPDVSGDWLLRAASGRTLAIHAGRYDETPLDCGRAGCHVAIADAAASSPMTSALRTRFDAREPPPRGGERGGDERVTCALPCHATGEASAHDGGFRDVAREMGVLAGEQTWATLPRALRRLGGVTCLGCHGPGTIPEPAARWSILRADVCATCHDAPPTYGHVAAWRSSRMSRADIDPRTRGDASCAGCHTTAGFLVRTGQSTTDRAAPSGAGPVGIACAACHAPHDVHARTARPPDATNAAPGESGRPTALLRQVALPPSLQGSDVPASSRACVSCHAPVDRPADRLTIPPASAAAIWSGSVGLDPETGAPLAGAPIHGDKDRGCTGCHAAGPPGLERGAAHAFAVDGGAACNGCHATGVPPRDDGLNARARDLLGRLTRGQRRFETMRAPAHAMATDLPGDARGRAIYDVLLVLEDPAASVHNGPYARALLEAARRVADASHAGTR